MRPALLALAAILVSGSALAAPPSHPQAEAQALDLAKKAIAMRSVVGPGNKTPEVAKLYSDALVPGGFKPPTSPSRPCRDTAYLIARWPGTDPALKPLVISGHMDVVEAKPADWQRDPFTPIVENGYLFGRGATDMKLSGTIAIAALCELRRQGFKPRRDHHPRIFRRRGDRHEDRRHHRREAQGCRTGAQRSTAAAGGWTRRPAAPEYFTWQGAEKTYADFKLSVTNPGGHSSEPRKDNAINQLAAALGPHRPVPLQAGGRASSPAPISTQAAKYVGDPKTAAAMRAFAANPADKAAIDDPGRRARTWWARSAPPASPP